MLIPLNKKHVDIQQFKKDMFKINQRTLDISNRYKCHNCGKTPPVIGEILGLSVNKGEKNSVYCPKCAEYIESELNKCT